MKKLKDIISILKDSKDKSLNKLILESIFIILIGSFLGILFYFLSNDNLFKSVSYWILLLGVISSLHTIIFTTITPKRFFESDHEKQKYKEEMRENRTKDLYKAIAIIAFGLIINLFAYL